MIPLWALIFYQSFKEGPLEMQGLIMSAAALGVSLAWLASAFSRRGAAAAALLLSNCPQIT